MGVAAFTLDGMRTKAPENGSREHWAVRKKRVAAERGRAYVRGVSALATHKPFAPTQTFIVKLTRIGLKKMDDDNAIGSLKHVRDGIADALGIDDGSPRIVWTYTQASGQFGVGVWIEWDA